MPGSQRSSTQPTRSNDTGTASAGNAQATTAAEPSFEADLMLRVETLVLELLKHLHKCNYDLTQLTPDSSLELRFTTPKTYFDAATQQWRRDRKAGSNAQKDNTYKLPGSDGDKQLARLLHVLATVYTAFSTDASIASTKRGMMYANTLLFPNQACSDQMLNTVASLLQCDQTQLRVRAACRGSCIGNVQWTQHEHQVNAMIRQNIPDVTDEWKLTSVDVNFVLCVESDSVFQLLAPAVSKSGSPLEHCLLMTSCGYVNKSFKRFLLQVVKHKPDIPVVVLVDFDIDGAWIYKHICFGGENDSGEMLGCSKAQWLGLLAQDVEQLLQQYPNQLQSIEQVDAAVVTQRTKSLESRPDTKHHPVIQEQCKAMRRLSIKAEIECLTGIGPKYLLNIYLAQKLQTLSVLPSDIDYSDWDRNTSADAQAASTDTVSDSTAPLSYSQYTFSDIPMLEYATQVSATDLDDIAEVMHADANEPTPGQVQQSPPAALPASQKWWWESSDDEAIDQ